MSYKAPKLSTISMAVYENNSGKDTASCCSGSCCYGKADAWCDYLF